MKRALLLMAAIALATGACREDDPVLPRGPAESPQPPRVLVFTKATGFRHDSIPAAIQALNEIGAEAGFVVDATEDGSVFTEVNLANYRAVAFVLTTGDILDSSQQGAFEAYIRNAGGFVGVHSATDTEYDWPFYGELLGAYFKGHPAIQQATIRIADPNHPATQGLPDPWMRTDEWYDLRSNPRGRVRVLATLDESTYKGGGMGADHPIAWCHQRTGRAFYTALGHGVENYSEPAFRAHLAGGILWAAGVLTSDCSAN